MAENSFRSGEVLAANRKTARRKGRIIKNGYDAPKRWQRNIVDFDINAEKARKKHGAVLV